jgi:hypothetical protein
VNTVAQCTGDDTASGDIPPLIEAADGNLYGTAKTYMRNPLF